MKPSLATLVYFALPVLIKAQDETFEEITEAEGESTIEPINSQETSKDPPPLLPLGRSASGFNTVKKVPSLDYTFHLLENTLSNPVKEPLDPDRGLENLSYLEYLLLNYPMGRGLRPRKRKKAMDACDMRRFKKCTCIDPPIYTSEGRGNCNVGSTMPDRKVWCYINPKFGSPLEVCPDAHLSEVMEGYFWSRFACITEGLPESAH